ncbi:VIT domain-containing protein [Glaciecola sp. 1036]|uniref:VIT domain-containing protein n=1 Tax=Alteromonadaceae TaxID=72275 RepID=UPI003D04F382
MTNITKITLFVAVVGLVAILHNLVDKHARANTVQTRTQEVTAPVNQVTVQNLSVVSSSSATDDEIVTSPQVTNIYQTETGSFYFSQASFSQNEAIDYTPAVLKSSHFKVKVTGPIQRTKVIQEFSNPSKDWQDGVYVFPLPIGAAVDSLKMIIDDREIIGEIKPKEEAKRIFEQAKASGKRASLVSQLRPNMFKNNVSNIPPDAKITVELEFQQLLDLSDQGYELRLPTGITPRYVPVASPEYIEASGHPVDTDTNELIIEVDLNMGVPLDSIESLHHEIIQKQQSKAQYYLRTTSDVNNTQSFVLRWQPKNQSHTQVSHIQESIDDMEYGLISLLAPQQPAAQVNRDITFILDTSGSMVGDSIIQAKEALKVAIKDLAPDDRFNLIEFDSDANALWGVTYEASEGNIEQAINFIDKLEADGGTEMLSALELAFELQKYQRPQSDHFRQLIFITDGSVANEAQVLAKIHNAIGDTRLFTIGIGSAPNEYFMQEAALAGRGTFTFIGDTNLVTAEMTKLLKKIKQPILTDLNIQLLHQGAPVDVDIFPSQIPDLYAGEPLHIFYRQQLLPQDSFKIELTGKQGRYTNQGKFEKQAWSRLITPMQAEENAGINKQWAYEKIQQLNRTLHTTLTQGDDYKALKEYTKEKVTELAMEHHIVSDYTSLIAVDHQKQDALERRMQTAGIDTQQFKLAQTATKSGWLNYWGLFILFVGAIGIAISSTFLLKKRAA